MDNFEYVDMDKIQLKVKEDERRPEEIQRVLWIRLDWCPHNELNTGAQMIFTVHDINFMDCKRRICIFTCRFYGTAGCERYDRCYGEV